MSDSDKDKSSFVSTLNLQFINFINKFCICYLKQSMGVKSVRGVISGIIKIGEEYLIQYDNEDGRIFHVPFSNIALFEQISKELEEKLKKQYEELKEKTQNQEEKTIRDEIDLKMEEVQHQKEQLNAVKPESAESSEREEEGDSDFVLQL